MSTPAAAYPDAEPTLTALAAIEGLVLIEFGAPWCQHCQGAQAAIHSALAGQSDVQHLRIEDGRGRPLGRSFKVKLWPSLIFVRNGQELARVVRPQDADAVRAALAQARAAS